MSSQEEIEQSKTHLRNEIKRLAAERDQRLAEIVARAKEASSENEDRGLMERMGRILAEYRALIDPIVDHLVKFECMVPRQHFVELMPATEETYRKVLDDLQRQP